MIFVNYIFALFYASCHFCPVEENAACHRKFSICIEFKNALIALAQLDNSIFAMT